MKTVAVLGMALILPLVGLVYGGRMLWSAVLAVLAGMGLACAKADDSKTGNTSGGTAGDPPQPVVTCYQQVNPTPVFADPKWQASPELMQWAEAERVILAMIRNERIDFSVLEPNIKYAENACDKAESAVGKGLLRAETYELAGQFFADWHQTIATTHSTILCYESRPVTPMIMAVNTQLTALNDMRRAGKLNKAAVEQATLAIKQRVGKETSPAVAEELSRFLMQMLEF